MRAWLRAIRTGFERTSMACKVSALVNYPTRYEVVLSNGTASYLVGYTSRKSRPGLMACIRQHGPAILRITELSESARFTWSGPIAHLGENNWTIRFSGRTQRDALCTHTELTFVEDFRPAEVQAF